MACLFNGQISGSDSLENDLISIDELFLSHEFCNVKFKEEFNFKNIHYFEVNLKKMLLVLKHPAKLYFKGPLLVECVSGAVEVHGFTLRPDDSGPYLVISGCGQSAVCLSSKEEHNVPGSELKIELSKRRMQQWLDILKECSASSVIILSKSDELPLLSGFNMETLLPAIQSPRNSSSYSFFNKLEEWFNCSFDFSSGSRIPHKMTYHPDLLGLADTLPVLEDPRVIICGGKGVGKSTALQYLVNRMFIKWKAVLVIDFDIGQPEFTIAGCVSVVMINHPLLGPYFTHLCKPLRSIVVGHVNPDMCLTKYFIAIDELKKFCSENENLLHIPWFINTMGYLKGFGLSFITKIISLFQPTHIVQINSLIEPNVNVLPLTSRNICEMLEYQLQEFKPLCDYTLVSFPAQNLKNTVFVPPRVSREIRVLSYMNELSSEPLTKEVSLKNKSPQEISLFKSNKVVAVCTPWFGSSCMQCIGFGVILEIQDDKVLFRTPLCEDNFKTDFDIFVIELGFQSVPWEKIFSFQNHMLVNKTVMLGKKSKFSFNFLF